MPERIVDAHVHIWASNQPQYPWRPEFGTEPTRLATIEDLRRDLRSAGITDALVIQPSVYAFDHTYLHSAIKGRTSYLRGVILADPLDPNCAETMREATHEFGIAGVRMIPVMADRGWFQPGAEAAWRAASELSLVMSWLVAPRHLRDLARWASRFPEVPVVIDHLGLPRRADSAPEDALAELLRTAQLPNVNVKLAAIESMSTVPPPYKDTWGWIRTTVEEFGPRRVLWGSNYPLVLDRGTIAISLNAVREALSDLSEEEMQDVFGGTARHLYHLDQEEAVS